MHLISILNLEWVKKQKKLKKIIYRFEICKICIYIAENFK